MSLARELLVGLVAVLREDPDLAEQLRAAVLGVEATEPEPPPVYMRVPAFAKRAGLSERSGWNLVQEGLPTIGEGRQRRVDVARADEWMRSRATAVDDSVERQARRHARKAAGK